MKLRNTILAAALATLTSTPVWADFISFTGFAANGPGTNDDLSAQADFTTSAGSLEVTLTNLLSASAIRSAGQALSDITFTLSDALGTMGAETASGQFGDVSTTGVVTFVATDSQTGNTTPIRWFANQ